MDEMDVRNFADWALRQVLQNPLRVRDLLRDVAPELAELLDWSQARAEPTRIFLPDGREREGDIACRAPVLHPGPDGPSEAMLLVLVEHQTAVDLGALIRLHLAAAKEWEKQWHQFQQGERSGPLRLTVVAAIILHTGDRPWRGPRSFRELFHGPVALLGLAPDFPIFLWELSRRTREQLATAGPLQALLMAAQAQSADEADFREATLAAMRALRAFQESGELPPGSAEWRLQLQTLVQWVAYCRPPSEYDALVAAMSGCGREWGWDKEIKPMADTMFEKLLRDGKAIGLAEGKAEGLALGLAEGEARGEARGEERGKQLGAALAKAESLLQILDRRLGPVPAELRQRVLGSTDLAALGAAFDKALDAKTFDEIPWPPAAG